jgi:hypothetical protein
MDSVRRTPISLRDAPLSVVSSVKVSDDARRKLDWEYQRLLTMRVLDEDEDEEQPPGTNDTWLHAACRYGAAAITKIITHRDNDIDVNGIDGAGRTPMHHAVVAGGIIDMC